MEKVDLLRSISLFEGLETEDLEALAASVVMRKFSAGHLIFSQGDPGFTMYIVADGHVNIHLPGEASRRVSLKDVTVGEYFGELALFDEKPRSASAVTTTSALLMELSRETLTDYLEKRPRRAMAILRTMAERLRETNSMLSERAAKNVVEDFEKNLSWSDRLADRVAELNGSWAFLIGLLLTIVGWTTLNGSSLFRQPFDGYPFEFFNLVLAILIALQGPLIVMSQNRQTLKDRAQAKTDFAVNLKNEVHIETILRELGEFRAESNQRLAAMERHWGLPPSDLPPSRRRS